MFALHLSDEKLEKRIRDYKDESSLNKKCIYEVIDDRCLHWKEKEKNPLKIVLDSLPDNVETYHKNYIQYLRKAWSNHYGVVVSPDKFWYIILTELANHIKENSERYRKNFTRTESGKESICVRVNDPVAFPMEQIIEELKKRIPMNTKLFLSEFTTTLPSDKFAMCSAFCDAMSFYYNYFTLLCGIPSVKVLGTKDDWKLISANLAELTLLDLAQPYLTKVKEITDEIVNNFATPSTDFWKNMFYIKHCGSGHQEEIYGWVTSLFMKPVAGEFPENFPSQVSIVPYENLSTQKSYKMYSGLFSSTFQEDGFLVPEFSYVVSEVEDDKTNTN